MRMMSTAKAAPFITLAAPCFTTSVLFSEAEERSAPYANIPSIITIEPSTTIPKSMAPKLIRLADTPKMRIRMKAKSIDRGITDATISPARTLPRKMMSTKNTITAPSIRL